MAWNIEVNTEVGIFTLQLALRNQTYVPPHADAEPNNVIVTADDMHAAYDTTSEAAMAQVQNPQSSSEQRLCCLQAALLCCSGLQLLLIGTLVHWHKARHADHGNSLLPTRRRWRQDSTWQKCHP